MKTHFKVALFLLGEYLRGVLIFLGYLGIMLVIQYILRAGDMESGLRVSSSMVFIIGYAGWRSMSYFEFFQSFHLSRRQFFIANVLALLAIGVVSVCMGPALEAILGGLLAFEYVSSAEILLAGGGDVMTPWAMLWSFNLHVFIVVGMWLLWLLHYRQWYWKTLMFIATLAAVNAFLSYYAGISLTPIVGAALSFVFLGAVDGWANSSVASANLAVAALLCIDACYLLLRRTPMR